MTKVDINGHDHQVTIEGDDPTADVANLALKIWQETVDYRPVRPGPGAAGFIAERQPQWDHDRNQPVR